MKILVTGATGHLGRDFVRAAAARGHALRLLSRRPAPADSPLPWVTGDLNTGAGLSAAVEGVQAVVHAASDPHNAASADVEGTHRLARAARNVGVAHFVLVSIVGIDRIPLGYYRHKLAAERRLADSGVPYSILRASQFHYFVDLQLRQLARIPLLLPIPAGFRLQSIGTADVAAELWKVVTGYPVGLLPDLAGPEPMTLTEAARTWVAVRGLRKRIVPLPVPGALAAGFRAGRNTAPDRPQGQETWRAWLEREVSHSTAA